MIIQNNIMALKTKGQLAKNSLTLAKSLEKLSSGNRINRAADDAAGLAISEKLRAQITGLETAAKNAWDGISLVQTAEGALTEVHAMLNRMTELATQSSNGIYDATDRQALDAEFQQLKSEINRISQSTNFNGIKLLDGSLSVDPAGNAVVNRPPSSLTMTIDPDTLMDSDLIGKTFTINGNTYEFTGQGQLDHSGQAIGASDGARLENGNFSVNISAGEWRIDGSAADGKQAASEFISQQIARAINTVTSVQAGKVPDGAAIDWSDESTYIKLAETRADGLGVTFDGASPEWGGNTESIDGYGLNLQIGDTADSYNILNVSVNNMSSRGLGIGDISIDSLDGASAAINALRESINTVSTQRGSLGALQNRLEHTINNLGVTTENLYAADSRIRDTDMAKEMIEFTRSNILMQTAQAMLAQANLLPQSVLGLLR